MKSEIKENKNKPPLKINTLVINEKTGTIIFFIKKFNDAYFQGIILHPGCSILAKIGDISDHFMYENYVKFTQTLELKND